ncbi:unnamed protein product [Vitrella brassicaformis CCMP3155]|uniref:Uncharacterized protein n=1 Tax=Vitrella brassicaformis (strain CCMP3155) TaxID=1169540 RepID=A0A0G4FMC5_VITBC|nr:unnamed protein product [Vitrella brassicaformis CCMP3155]|eukprot:CEM15000.1 unnamed protein product [Vitrella brassicaformis CCMP3155]
MEPSCAKLVDAFEHRPQVQADALKRVANRVAHRDVGDDNISTVGTFDSDDLSDDNAGDDDVRRSSTSASSSVGSCGGRTGVFGLVYLTQLTSLSGR